jgi:hypothetical protein
VGICPKTKKIRHSTIEGAWAHGSAVVLKKGVARAYRCEFCGDYHVTSQKWCTRKKAS